MREVIGDRDQCRELYPFRRVMPPHGLRDLGRHRPAFDERAADRGVCLFDRREHVGTIGRSAVVQIDERLEQDRLAEVVEQARKKRDIDRRAAQPSDLLREQRRRERVHERRAQLDFEPGTANTRALAAAASAICAIVANPSRAIACWSDVMRVAAA